MNETKESSGETSASVAKKGGGMLFADAAKRKRYGYALSMILLMAAVSEWSGEKEIIFPEMAALAVGMWVSDKRVWAVKRWQTVLLMTAGAAAGVCIVRYSPFPLIADIAVSFIFSSCCILFSRTTLVPQISACMLPVLLRTESWVYPAAVLTLSLIVVTGQYFMERSGVRPKAEYAPVVRQWKKDILRWSLLMVTVLAIAALPVATSRFYCILPPLVVTYVEFANSKAGFRNRPVQTFLLLTGAASLGAFFCLVCRYGGLPDSVAACLSMISLFVLFEWQGKFFAPAAAVALVPLIIPQEDLFRFPWQVAVGAASFILTAMLLFLRCFRWSKAHLAVCLVPAPLRNLRRFRMKTSGKM